MRALALALSMVFAAATLSGRPTITRITPSSGPIAGGTTVTLTGTQFTGATLKVGETVVTPISATDMEIVFVTPKHNNGIATIAVQGTDVAEYTEFLYLPPRIEDLPPGFITTVMGIGSFRGDGRRGREAMYYADGGTNILLAPDGALYFSEPEFQVIRRLRADGVVERVAGTGDPGAEADGGIAARMKLQRPRGLAFDRQGNLLFTETFSVHRIRRIDKTTGVVTTIAGSAQAGFSGDGGPAVQALFHNPTDIAADSAGNLYVLDFDNARIRRIDPNGIVSTIAGTGTQGFSGDGGPATAAMFNVGVYDNGGIAVDSRGNVYLAETAGARVRKIDTATGIISTFVSGTGTVYGVAVDRADNVYVAYNELGPSNSRIRQFTPDGQLVRAYGLGFGFSEDGAEAASAKMGLVWRVLVEPDGAVLFADAGRVRRINLQTGRLETLLGILPHVIGETGPALATAIPGVDLLFLPTGELLTGEVTNYLIRKMSRDGNVSVIAGNGSLTSAPVLDGAKATEVSINPAALALAPNGDIYLTAINGVCRIDAEGRIHPVTKLGVSGFAGDGGPAILAELLQPADLACDRAGNVLVADMNNNRIRRIDAATGIITTVVGSGPTNGLEGQGRGSFCGDGGPATEACINSPVSVAVSDDGSMFIGEGASILQFTGELIDRIRRVDRSGTITTLARFKGVSRIRSNNTGNLFMGRLRIQPTGHMYAIIGDAPPSATDNGDGGTARSAHCIGFGIAIDADGNLYCSDAGSQRVRAVRYGAVIAEPGSSVTLTEGDSQGTPLGQPFERSLSVTVRSPAGTLENGIRVDFVAPSNGASCRFQTGAATFSTLTDVNGRAAARCTATGGVGAYEITVTPLALGADVRFKLTNTPALPRRRSARH